MEDIVENVEHAFQPVILMVESPLHPVAKLFIAGSAALAAGALVVAWAALETATEARRQCDELERSNDLRERLRCAG